jgi:hypothetical protein
VFSSPHQPAPRPISNRPFETWSIVAACFARRAGCLKAAQLTTVPKRTRVVCVASAASAVQASNKAASSRAAVKWSQSQMLLNPSSS